VLSPAFEVKKRGPQCVRLASENAWDDCKAPDAASWDRLVEFPGRVTGGVPTTEVPMMGDTQMTVQMTDPMTVQMTGSTTAPMTTQLIEGSMTVQMTGSTTVPLTAQLIGSMTDQMPGDTGRTEFPSRRLARERVDCPNCGKDLTIATLAWSHRCGETDQTKLDDMRTRAVYSFHARSPKPVLKRLKQTGLHQK